MSEMTSVVEQHQRQQQQQYAGGEGLLAGLVANNKLCCKDCGMNFDSSSSLEVHLRYHQENLLSQWASQTGHPEESNNNSCKAGNQNSGCPPAGAHQPKRDSVTAPADSSEPSPRPASGGPAAPHAFEQQRRAPAFHAHYQPALYAEAQYFAHGEPAYAPPQHYSPDRGESEAGPGARGPQQQQQQQQQQPGYARYHPYQQHQQQRGAVGSASPRSPLRCDKCGAVCEGASQLAEHVAASHPSSPGAAAYPAPGGSRPQQPAPPRYQQLAGSPRQRALAQSHQASQAQAQQQQQQQQQSMLASPSRGPPPSQPGYDFAAGAMVKAEIKQEPEEQSEILDLDSHKVQTHRCEDEFIRIQQHQQEMQMQMQHQVMQQHQSRSAAHSVSSLLSWPPESQPHEYHSGMSPMGHMGSVSPIQEQQNQFLRNQQHMSSVEPARHPSSPIITSTQQMAVHSLPSGLMQQNPKPPPLGNQSWKSNEARRPKTYNCTACNKWFTSSGHLKRHYNTTLHKNAVKQSNQPDPANLPISAHHHPGRDSNSRNAVASRTSPDLTSSSSPPNLMAGPSGEATRGLLHTPTTTAIFSNTNSNSSSNSSEATAVQTSLNQKVLHHQEQAQQLQARQQSSTIMLASNLVFLDSPGSQIPQHQFQQQSHIRQQMDSPSPRLGQQPSQHHHLHHMPMGSPSQIGASGQHPTNSRTSPMPQHQVHMNSPSPMASVHQHMNSPSPIMAGVVPASIASPPVGHMMAGTMMPHQPYPNALPPHVTAITSIPALLESITSQPITTGNSDIRTMPTSIQQSRRQEMLSVFGTFNNHQQQQQKLLPSLNGANGFLVGQGQPQAINVGGLSPEENMPQDRSFESSVSNYDMYRTSPPRYDSISSMDMSSTETPVIISTYAMLQGNQYGNQHLQSLPLETNNNLPNLIKEGLNCNTLNGDTKMDKENNSSNITKEHQVTSTNTGAYYISQNGLHKCIKCDKVFNKACYLTQHNKSFHSGDKPYKCNQCGKRFPHEYLHDEHLQKHAGDKPYKCEICPKQFNHKTDLRRHMCLHSGDKPYACSDCGKGFIRKDHMMKHLETHKKKAQAGHASKTLASKT